MMRVLATLCLVFFLASCSGIAGIATNAAISTLTGNSGGPSLEANIGRTVDDSTVSVGKSSKEIKSGDNSNFSITESTTNETDYWLIAAIVVLAIAFGSLVDNAIAELFKKLKRKR